MRRPLAYVAGTGRAVPAHAMSNHDFAAIGIETSHDWIVERTGIHQRYISRNGETTAGLAAEASRAAMERAGVHAGELDIIVLGTASPDRLLPSTAVEVQAQLGASRAAAFDIDAACTGFIYGMTVAEGMIASGIGETALVIGVERLSTIVDWQDRSTCILFGDGAGAAVLRRTKQHQKGLLSAFVRSDGSLADLLHRPAGGAVLPFSEQVMQERSQYMKMAGREVFKAAVLAMAEATDEALRRACVTAEQIDLFVPHQANVRIIEATAKHASIPMDKVMVNLDRYGNTSAASIPLALDQAIREGRVRPGALLLFVAFGAGFTWGSAVVRW